MTKYTVSGTECIIYNIPEDFKSVFENPTKCKLLENKSLPIYNFLKMKRDRILEREGIITFENLQAGYFLCKLKSLDKPARVRKYLIEKYEEVLAESERTDFNETSQEDSSENTESDSNPENA